MRSVYVWLFGFLSNRPSNGQKRGKMSKLNDYNFVGVFLLLLLVAGLIADVRNSENAVLELHDSFLVAVQGLAENQK